MVEIGDLSSIISVLVLGAASYQDVRRREVSDWIWAIGATAGAAAQLPSLICMRGGELMRLLVSSAPLLLILTASWLGRLMGEADILALITLLIVNPCPRAGEISPPAFSTLIYACSLMALTPLGFLARNIFLLARGEAVSYTHLTLPTTERV